MSQGSIAIHCQSHHRWYPECREHRVIAQHPSMPLGFYASLGCGSSSFCSTSTIVRSVRIARPTSKMAIKAYLLSSLMHPVHLVRHRGLFSLPTDVLRSVQLALALLPYFILFHLRPRVLDGFIFTLLNCKNKRLGQYVYHPLVPFSLERLALANTRVV